jgi:hypothetical protein
MGIDDAIVQLAEKLDAWADTNLDTLSSMDQAERVKAVRTVLEITIDLERIKAEGVAAIKAVLDHQGAATQDERVVSLVRSFEFAAKLSDTLSDEWLDTDGVNQVVDLMNDIASQLDATRSGRAALAVLLDHADARVRASAGAYLVALMPDRVLPILREIEKTERANSAHFAAHWAILGWEREGK